jgi:hypothetical protein
MMSNLQYSKARSYTAPYTGTKRREWELEDVHHGQEYRLTQSEGWWKLERNGGWFNARVLWDFRGRWQSANLREAKKMVVDLIAGKVTL